MAGERFTQEDWDKGADAPEALEVVQAVLGVLPSEAPALERDRHFTRQGRMKAGKVRTERLVRAVTRPRRRQEQELVEKTRFVLSRLARLPIADKRRPGVEEVTQPHQAQAIAVEHEIAVASGRADVAQRIDSLRASRQVDALREQKRSE